MPRLPVVATLATVLLAAVLASLPGSPAAADELADATRNLEETAQTLRLTRERIDFLEELLDEGRIHLAPVPVEGGGLGFDLVTYPEAVRYRTFDYLEAVLRGATTLSSAGLADHVRKRLAEGRRLDGRIRESLARLEAVERRLGRARADLEQRVAELRGPQRTGRCVDLLRVDRRGVLGEAADAGRGALRQGVSSRADTGRGWTGDFSLTWTAPPDRICVGLPFEIELVARNNGPVEDPLLGRAAPVGMSFSVPQLEARCTNPPPFDPDAAAFVGPTDTGYVNACTVEVRTLGRLGAPPVVLVRVSLDAIPHAGALAYVYQ